MTMIGGQLLQHPNLKRGNDNSKQTHSDFNGIGLINGLVLKVASACNLNCTYCYMYNKGDKTYKFQPKFMSEQIVEATLLNVRNYLKEKNFKKFSFVFHGGEPLLIDPGFFKFFVRKASEIIPEGVDLKFSIQTNATLLTPEWCEILGKLNIRIGISLDGFTDSENKERLDFKKKSSFERTLKGFQTAENSEFLDFHTGVLMVINPTQDPALFYERIKKNKVMALNLLFPNATHDYLPTIWSANKTIYADWLLELYNIWVNDIIDEKPKISIFQQLQKTNPKYDEGYYTPKNYLIIETDGGIEPEDMLKICGNAFTKTNLNIKKHSLGEALLHPLIEWCSLSHKRLNKKCKVCPVRKKCWGGFISHRYSQKNGFDNPSVYCKDLFKFFSYIQKS